MAETEGALPTGRRCLRDPIPEILDAARYLDAAVSAHLIDKRALADELFRLADMPAVRDWTESLWGSKSPYLHHRRIEGAPPILAEADRNPARAPSNSQKAEVLARDGYRCRFCGIPVIRPEIRDRIRAAYPAAVTWGRTNATQHAAFQAMWAQFDHVVPHARGGASELENMVITCAPCNFGRMEYTLAEVGLLDPRLREPVTTTWDGLERFA